VEFPLVVKCVISGGTPVAKATSWPVLDAEARKLGEQRDRYPESSRKRWTLGVGGINPAMPKLTH